MKESKTKKLRDFIKSHEMRYFVTYQDYIGQTHIKKAFKVEINNNVYWLYFRYGDRPEIIAENTLVKTMAEAKAKADKLREAHKRKKEKESKEKKEKFTEVTKYLERFDTWDLRKGYGDEIKQECQPFVDAITRIFNRLPDKQKQDETQAFINMLLRYIQTGTFYNQGKMFRKEQVVQIEYGKDGSVCVELTNGDKITPADRNFTSLIKAVFGSNTDGWYYTSVEYPEKERDEVEHPKWK